MGVWQETGLKWSRGGGSGGSMCPSWGWMQGAELIRGTRVKRGPAAPGGNALVSPLIVALEGQGGDAGGR